MAFYGNPLGSGLGAERRAYLEKTMLTNINQMTQYDKLATIVKSLPQKNSKRIEFDKWVTAKELYFANNLNKSFTGNDSDAGEETLIMVPRDEYQNFVLDEGSSGTSKAQMKLIKLTTDVFYIGDWMPYTEELEVFHDKWSTSEAARQMSDIAALVIDGFYRDLYYNGAGHVYDITGDGSGNDNVIDAAFATAERNLYLALKLSGGEPIKRILSSSPDYGTVPVNSRYLAHGHTIACDRLRDNPGFIEVKDYAAGITPLENEVGMLGFTRFCEDPNGYIEHNGTNYDAEFIVGANEHTAQVPLKGKSRIEAVYQRLGSGGTSDPLSRVGSLGWKSVLGAKTLYPERLGILKARFDY